jgi:hypothetical protein
MRSWPGVLSGVVGGALGGIALLWATVPLPRATVQAIGFPATYVPGLRLIAGAILVQALVAGSAVVVTERLKLIHAMFAAFLAANILVFAMGVRAALDDARWHTVFFTLRFSYAPTIIGGLTVALAVALLALLLTRAISALRALIWREA